MVPPHRQLFRKCIAAARKTGRHRQGWQRPASTLACLRICFRQTESPLAFSSPPLPTRFATSIRPRCACSNASGGVEKPLPKSGIHANPSGLRHEVCQLITGWELFLVIFQTSLFSLEPIMFLRFVPVFVVASAALGLGFANTEVAKEKATDCCTAKMACCGKDMACCVAKTKQGCCAKGQACCEKKMACCTGVQECCRKGEACCAEAKACCGGSAKKVAKAAQNCCESGCSLCV